MTTTHPEVEASFRADGHGGFISRNGGGFVSCPPYVIAAAAARAAAGLLVLPEGYGTHILEQVKNLTGWAERDVHVSGRQAEELAEIGRQLLAAGEEKISPPLGYFERQSVEHLVRLTEAVKTGDQKS